MKITVYNLSLIRRNIGTFSLSHHFAGGFFFSLESSAVKLPFSNLTSHHSFHQKRNGVNSRSWLLVLPFYHSRHQRSPFHLFFLFSLKWQLTTKNCHNPPLGWILKSVKIRSRSGRTPVKAPRKCWVGSWNERLNAIWGNTFWIWQR